MCAPARRRRSSPSRSSATCSGLRPRNIHVFTERVGGGFGGKQEMLSEDLCVLATLKIGRPVKWEFTREEQFIGATTRHQMTTRVKLGAKRDGTLTAIEIHVVSNTGAYGGHGGETLGGGARQSDRGLSLRQQEGRRLRGLYQHGAGGRLSRLRRVADDLRDRIARWTSWRSCSGWIRSRSGARTWSGPSDWIESVWKDPSDVGFGSYGLDQCMDLVENALAERTAARQSPRAMNGPRAPASRWRCSNAARRPSTAPGRR